MIRKTIFWAHLVSGVAAGLVILMMSVTGVILTYERQILAWADARAYPPPFPSGERLPLESLIASVSAGEPEFLPSSITVSSDPAAHVAVGAGRGESLYVDPYSGAVLGAGAVRLREFFAAVTGWHRWFNATGEHRGPWRAVTGASNLLFLFLVLSGVYLWLPRVAKWAMFRARLLFVSRPATGHARDFNWHHVLGIWSAMPLAVVVATAVVFSYSWGNDLVYRAFGEQPPQRGRGAPPAREPATAAARDASPATQPRSLEELFAAAAGHRSGWRRISMQLPGEHAQQISFAIDLGNGGQPQLRHSLVLDRATGEPTSWAPFQSQTPGRQARSWVRFLHTGEALGIGGQTIAGLVSLTSTIMVWTGLALAFRRLIVPRWRRGRSPAVAHGG